jgi:hypothetical protein
VTVSFPVRSHRVEPVEEAVVRAMIVYESMFGNTRDVADAVALGLRIHGLDVSTVEVGQASVDLPDDLDLLVVGAPTHALSLSRTQTRESAAEQAEGPLVSTGPGVREWLERLPKDDGRRVATFDTHVDKKIPGSASKAARKRLRRLGFRAVAPAESFYVSDVQGPLIDGELERARAWGTRLATGIGANRPTGSPGPKAEPAPQP